MFIKEVSEKFNLSQDTLRYYERIGLLPPVPRNKSGIRQYDQESLNWIEFNKCMRASGLPIEALIEYVSLFQEGESTANARMEILIEQRDLLAKRVEEMTSTLKRLDDKIIHYQQAQTCEERLGLVKEEI